MGDSPFIDGAEPQICSFCGWSSKDSTTDHMLIHHVGVNICSNCVGRCDSLLNQRGMFLSSDLEYYSWFTKGALDYDAVHGPSHLSEPYCFSEELASAHAEIARLRAVLQSVGVGW